MKLQGLKRQHAVSFSSGALYWHSCCHCDQALSSAQVPAEYYVITKPDTNMAEASEEAQAEKMETDGQEQEDGADEQKRNDEGTIQEVLYGCLSFHMLQSQAFRLCH